MDPLSSSFPPVFPLLFLLRDRVSLNSQEATMGKFQATFPFPVPPRSPERWTDRRAPSSAVGFGGISTQRAGCSSCAAAFLGGLEDEAWRGRGSPRQLTCASAAPSCCLALGMVCLWAPAVGLTSACWGRGSPFSLRAGLCSSRAVLAPRELTMDHCAQETGFLMER